MAFKNKSSITLNCQECNEPVKNVSSDATAVTCWKCVTKSLSGKPILKEEEYEQHKDNKNGGTAE